MGGLVVGDMGRRSSRQSTAGINLLFAVRLLCSLKVIFLAGQARGSIGISLLDQTTCYASARGVRDGAALGLRLG